MVDDTHAPSPKVNPSDVVRAMHWSSLESASRLKLTITGRPAIKMYSHNLLVGRSENRSNSSQVRSFHEIGGPLHKVIIDMLLDY